MLPKSERPHFARTNLKEKEKIDRGKQKLLLLNLKRICYKRISDYLNTFKTIIKHEANTINSAFRRVERNIQFCKIMAWKKLVYFAKLRERQNRILKFMMIASSRYQNQCLSYSFRKTNRSSIKIFTAKANIMKNALMIQPKKLLVYSFAKLRQTKIMKEHLKNKYRLFQKLMCAIVKQRKYYGWSRVLGVSSPEHKDVEHELGQITKERDALRKELSKKNKEMENLQNQVAYKDQQIISYNTIRTENRHRNSSLQNSRRSFKSIGSNKRGSSKDLSQKKSQVGSFENNTSILSWLNGSFMSIKSGKSNKSKSINGFQCYCKYRQKYNQYKAEAASLKNQLEIIKSELEVTKDLNDHLQFEISNLCINDSIESPELQLLRKEVKQLRKQKDIMKDKALKNQKYIANLKYQFKMKIENLYRNLKKTNN